MAIIDPEVKVQRKLERLSQENSMLRALNRKLARQGAGFDHFMEELQGTIEAERKSPFLFVPTIVGKHKPKTSPPIDKNHSETAALVLSDWHLSECVRPDETNGLNEYNSIIAANRVWNLVQTAKQIIRLHQAIYKIDRIWLPILGDMVSGSIHLELSESNDLSDAAAAILVSRLLYMVVMELETLGVPIEIDCEVGNHGRQTPTMPTKRQTKNNFDWVAYEMLHSMLAKDNNVTMRIHNGPMSVVKQYSWNYIIDHGYGVKHGKEEDFESRLRALFDDPEYRKVSGHTGTSFDQAIIGDQHRPKILERTIVNGSLTGASEMTYAWRLRPIRAIQQMFGISKEHSRTWHYPIDCTEIRSSKPDNPFSKYATEFLKKNGRH